MDKNTEDYFLRHIKKFPDGTNLPKIYYKAHKQKTSNLYILLIIIIIWIDVQNLIFEETRLTVLFLTSVFGFHVFYMIFLKNRYHKHLKNKNWMLDKIVCFIENRHFVTEFFYSNLDKKGNDKEILHYLLFQLYKNKHKDEELEKAIDNYLKFINGKYIYTYYHYQKENRTYNYQKEFRYSVEEFNKRLERNQDYRKENVRKNIDRIITEIRDYEYKLQQKRADTYIKSEANSEKIQNLITNTNIIYRSELYDTVIMMNRKIVENLLIQLYQKHGHRLAWYDTKHNRQKTLGALKNQFEKDMSEIESITGVKFNDNFINQIENIQNKGNRYVHSANYLDLKTDIEELESDINNVILILNKIDEQLENIDEEISHKEG